MKTKMFWTIVLRCAFRRAWAGAKMKWLIGALAALLIGFGCYDALALARFIDYPTFNGNSLATFAFSSGTIAVPFVLLLYLFGKHVLDIPVEINNSQSNEIHELRDEWESRYVKAKLEINVYNDKAGNRAAIKIRNRLHPTLTDLRVELINAIWIEPSITKSLITDNSPNHRFSEVDSIEHSSIRDDECASVWIAGVDPLGELVLLPQSKDKRSGLAGNVALWAMQHTESDFQLELKIEGYMDGRPIKVQTFKPFIHFRKRVTYRVPIDNGVQMVHAAPVVRINEIMHDKETEP